MERRIKDEYGSTAPNDLLGGVKFRQKECDVCGEKTQGITADADVGDPIVCSHECYIEWRDKNKWTNQRKYGQEWDRIRKECLEEAEYRCEMCDITNRRCKKKYSSSLHVHHIKPLRECVSTKQANKKSNLEVLCPRCHGVEERQ